MNTATLQMERLRCLQNGKVGVQQVSTLVSPCLIFEPGSVLKSKLAVSVLEKVPRRNRDGVKVSREKLFII